MREASLSGGLTTRLPNVEIFGIARRRHVDPFLSGRAIQGRADVLFGIRQLRQRYFQRLSGLEPIEVTQQFQNDGFVFSVAALREIGLRYGFKVHRDDFGLLV